MKFHTLFFPMHLLGFLVFGASLDAQVRVTFVVDELTTIKHDSIYISGTFNQWDSFANKAYLLKPFGLGKKKIVLTLPPGTIQYKFTRGNWLSVEKNPWGNEIENRELAIRRDTTVTHSIGSWADETLEDIRYALALQQHDTGRIREYIRIAYYYAYTDGNYNADSAFHYAQYALRLQQKLIASGERIQWSQKTGGTNILPILDLLGDLLHSLGNYPKALEMRFKGLELAENARDSIQIGLMNLGISEEYLAMKDYPSALVYAKTGRLLGGDRLKLRSEYNLAYAFYHLNQLDSALHYANILTAGFGKFDLWSNLDLLAHTNLLLGDIYEKTGDRNLAFSKYQSVILNTQSIFWYAPDLEVKALAGVARCVQYAGKSDSALVFVRRAIALLQDQDQRKLIQQRGQNPDHYLAEIGPLAAEIFKTKGQMDSAFFYLQHATALRDSLFNADKIRQFQTLTFNETARKEQLELEKRTQQQQYQTRLKMSALWFALAAFLLVAFILYRNNRQKQTANALLHTQKEEIEKTLAELKSTQTQLIQSEKLASLGELTAGIAHEIQNPLNFVNNFSEVSAEMLNELKEELAKGETEEVHAIADDLKTNLQKITHHGQRASSIVKSMLEHSRQGRDAMHRVSTDINALADEYMRLAYHGWRAKDNGFNCNIETHFDPELPLVSVIPQDIGRVLLNLIGNAFYAVHQRATTLGAPLVGAPKGHPYQPTVTVSTQKIDNQTLIRVTDNGPGIPEPIREKIFQPFFTTKPTGQGTGLGLSLSYDIVKAHGGAITAESNEDTGTTFTITL
ncbi:MAG: hypothetical protein IPN20_09120 [Haliscomenobacter sp.]|nr:hypothetical protein [Haliscomenobacter sp.]